jgi:hypothetical protein
MLPNLLSGLPLEAGVVTRQISAENPTGEKGGGCHWIPDPNDPNLAHSAAASDLGKGWKVRPFIALKSGETVTLADIQGPGTINQLFLTSDLRQYRALVLRMYWDSEATPSVEVPLGDFFAMGHDSAPHEVYSAPITVAPSRGCNSYFQMPFRKHARITLENEGSHDARIVAYRVLYKLHAVPDEAAYFHAQWRRSMTTRDHPEHVIVDGIKGTGLYVGTYLAWAPCSSGWWGEGEVKFYIDGDGEHPSFADNGTEDYFGGAWCFHNKDGLEQPFNSPYLGMPLARLADPRGPRLFSLYRWHLLDSIGFARDFRATVQALGNLSDGKYEPLTDDIASVAYWYQHEPHGPFPKLPTMKYRVGR